MRGEADVTCSCDTETFLLMSYGRLPSNEAISSGRLKTEGDATAITRFSESGSGGFRTGLST